jgi:simple sugar transport system ATP-binding protein
MNQSIVTAPPAAELRGVTVRFPGVLANDQVDLTVRAGEVHALLGENGAGKSTLMNVLAGLYRPHAGEVRLWGAPAALRSPREAAARGVGMVHQHFMLVPTLTVAENVLLGLSRPRFWLCPRAARRRVADWAAQHGLALDPAARVAELSVGEQQRVEILKVLARGARLLILDEPTAVLAPGEVGALFATLRGLAAAGRAVVLISHKLDEVAQVADRATVLRSGRVVVSGLDARAASPSDLARWMVGHEVGGQVERPPVAPGAPRLEVDGLWVEGDRGSPALRGVSFAVRAGEIVGVAGVAGNGQRELAEALTGLRRPTAGGLRVDGVERTGAGPREMLAAGVAHVPEDRAATGSAPRLSLAENLLLTSYRSVRGRLDATRLRALARQRAARSGLELPALEGPAAALSGGNLQRLILARELAVSPRVLVAVHPTRGLDVGATRAVHELLARQRAAGVATLLISGDLEEVLALSDRVLVLYAGRVAGVLEAVRADRERVGCLMTGGAP